MRLPRIGTLVKIALAGGFITAATGCFLQYKLIGKYQRESFYKEALKSLRQSIGAKHYLGEPIKDKTFKITDSANNYCDNKEARFKVPVTGTKSKGMYYFWANNVDGKWELQRAELELHNEPNKRLVVIKSKEPENMNATVSNKI